MMLGVRQYSEQVIRQIPHMPDAVKDKAIAGMTGVLDRVTPQAPDASTLYYKPEYTWSYEAGIHHNLADKMLQLDLAVFCMKTHDQQIARFAQSGMGRVMVNAGRSRSTGVEVGLRSQLAHDRLTLTANYGYTHAKFTRYDLGTSASGTRVDYTGNRVPFVLSTPSVHRPMPNCPCRSTTLYAHLPLAPMSRGLAASCGTRPTPSDKSFMPHSVHTSAPRWLAMCNLIFGHATLPAHAMPPLPSTAWATALPNMPHHALLGWT